MIVPTRNNIGVSFCIPVMNRTFHLKQTLPYNLKQLKNIKNVEFIILNYNSRDDIDGFMKNFKKEMKNKILTYYKEKKNNRNIFKNSHAFNMVFKLATKDILCLTCADYFISLGWYKFIIDNMKPGFFIKNDTHDENNGRSAFWKKDFKKLCGFDELMTFYGYEDDDFYNRAEIMGLKPISIVNRKEFHKCIHHGNEIRLPYYGNNKKIAQQRPGVFKVNPDGYGQGTIIEKNLKRKLIKLK